LGSYDKKYLINMPPRKQPQIQNLQIFLIEGTSLTGSFEAFHSSLAQSTGELWLKLLGKSLESPCAKILSRAGFKGNAQGCVQ